MICNPHVLVTFLFTVPTKTKSNRTIRNSFHLSRRVCIVFLEYTELVKLTDMDDELFSVFESSNVQSEEPEEPEPIKYEIKADLWYVN